MYKLWLAFVLLVAMSGCREVGFHFEASKVGSSAPLDLENGELNGFESSPAPRPMAIPLNLAGVFCASGWQGDAATPHGPLSRQIIQTDEPHSCVERWAYSPLSTAPYGFVGVAYQSPPNNWGQLRGKNLSKHGFRRLCFRARSCSPHGARVLFLSGGNTQPRAAFPATHECELDGGVVSLDDRWRLLSINLERVDLSNVCAAFTFIMSRDLNPDGCQIDIADLRLE